MENKKAVIYCRVSTEEQADKGESLASQERRCLAYAQHQGLQVVERFIERGVSGRTANRPQFIRMEQFVIRNKIPFIVCVKIDRFMRNTLEYSFAIQKLKRYNVKVLFVEGTNANDAGGKLQQDIAASFAEYESNLNSERTRLGNEQAFLSGRWIKQTCGYSFRPQLVGGQTKKVLTPNDDAKHVIKAFELMGKGIYSQREVLRELAKDGFKMYPQNFSRILTNSVYCGILPDMHNMNRGKPVQGIHQALVSKELFNRVQDVLKGRRPHIVPHLRNNPDFPLRRSVLCPKCGHKLTASKHKGEHGHYGYYYWCQHGCHYSLRKQDLEPKYYEYLQELTPSPRMVKLLEAIIIDKWNSQVVDIKKQSQEQERKIKQLKETKSRLLRMAANTEWDGASSKDIKDEIVKINNEINEAEVVCKQAAETIDVTECWEFAQYFLTHMADLWQTAGIDLRQRIQGLITPEGFVLEGEFIKPIKNPYFISILCQKNKDYNKKGG